MEFLYFFAKRFIAGNHIGDAINRAKLLEQYKIKSTLDILGEDVKSITDARYAVQQYQQLIEEIRKNSLSATVSIKLTHLGLALNKDICLTNVEKILSFADKNEVTIEIDMESSQYTEDTIKIYADVIKKYPCTIITIQSYLKRSMNDVEKLVKKHARIRLVKGAYKESSVSAFSKKKDVDKNYEEIMQFCLKNAEHVHIATHDEKLIMKAVKFIELNNIPEEKYEFAFLLGVKEKLQKRLAKDNFPVRVYVPFGEHWLPYTLRRLRERRANLWFAIRSIFLNCLR